MFTVIGLNPSTANETDNDPTVTRCIGFAHREGCGGLMLLNLFAYRATSPKALKTVQDPVGPDNNESILSICHNQDRVIVAWGNHGQYCGRDRIIYNKLKVYPAQLKCFGLTNQGQPRHPLYLRKNTPLIPFAIQNY